MTPALLAGAVALATAGCGSDNPTSPAPAPQPTVDQAFEPGAASALVGIGQTGAWAQTFTVGRTGTLTSIDLLLDAQGADDLIRIDIRGTTGGDPNLDDGVVASSRLVAASSLPDLPNAEFVTIDLGEGIPCVNGQTLAIVLIRVVGSGSSDVLWITENETGEDYTGGTGGQRIGGSGAAWTTLNGDFYFRTRILSP